MINCALEVDGCNEWAFDFLTEAECCVDNIRRWRCVV